MMLKTKSIEVVDLAIQILSEFYAAVVEETSLLTLEPLLMVG